MNYAVSFVIVIVLVSSSCGAADTVCRRAYQGAPFLARVDVMCCLSSSFISQHVSCALQADGRPGHAPSQVGCGLPCDWKWTARVAHSHQQYRRRGRNTDGNRIRTAGTWLIALDTAFHGCLLQVLQVDAPGHHL